MPVRINEDGPSISYFMRVTAGRSKSEERAETSSGSDNDGARTSNL